MQIVINEMEGMFASPVNHPVTVANPSPWKIIATKITIYPIKVWIRGNESIWFRADQCHIGRREDLE